MCLPNCFDHFIYLMYVTAKLVIHYDKLSEGKGSGRDMNQSYILL